MLITVLGPDGTGKTTLAKSLAKKMDNFTYLYFGYNNELRIYKYFNSFMKCEKKNIFYRIVRKFLLFVNDFAVYSSANEVNVISDRCPIDSFINTKIQARWIRFYYYIILKFLPSPQFVILLEGNSEIIYNRKKEISKYHIKKSIIFYKEYLISNKINYISVDTTENDIQETYNIVFDVLKNNI